MDTTRASRCPCDNLRSPWLWTAVLALGACGPPAPAVVVPAPEPVGSAATPEPAVTRYALVWGNAFVYTQPSTDGVKARGRSYADLARVDNAGDVWPVEVLEDEGELVKVRTLGGEDAGHCYRGPSLLNAFSIVLHVARSDLAPVVEEPAAGSFDDGTWVALNAGVAVSRSVARVDGLRVPVPPSVKLGVMYAHAHRFDMRDVKQQTRTSVFVKGVEIAGDALTSVPLSQASDAQVSVLSGCLAARAQAPAPPQLAAYHAVDARDAASPTAPKTAKHFPIGTEVYFPDGREAGVTIDAIAMSLLEKKNDLLCFQRSFADHTPGEPMPEHHTIDLCVKASAAREKAQPRATFPVTTQPPVTPP